MSGEALEPEPSFAAELFGDRIELARLYARHLGERGVELGLIGPSEAARLWSRHLVNCALVAPLFGDGPVGDVGSGAGLPGIVIAIANPRTPVVLIEPMERRIAWLEQEVRELDLTNVQVLRARAEDAVLDEPLAQVTARAVTAFRKLVPLCAPLVRHGGEMVFMKGRGATDEVNAASEEIKRHGLVDVEVLELGSGVVEETTRVIRARLGLGSA